VNTLSGKADSFLEHATQRQRYALLARSRPSTLENIPSGVFVPIENKATFASVNTNGQGLRKLRAARRAELAGVIRGHLLNLSTGTFGLVRKDSDEARPSYVGYRSGESIVLDHPLDVQAFDSNLAIARNQIVGNFLLVFAAAVGHPSVHASDSPLLLLAITPAFLFPGDEALCATKFRQLIFKVTRVVDLLAVRERSEVSQSYVESDSRQEVSYGRDISHIGRNDEVPFVSLAFEGKRLDVPFNFSVKTDSDRPDMLHPQFVTLEPYAVAVAWVKNRVETVSAFETRVTRRFACLNSSKEIGERFIQTLQGSLCTAEVNRSKPAIVFPLVLEPAGLIGVASRNLPLVVEPLTLRQSQVVESPVSLQHDFKFAFLVRVRLQSEFVSLEHLVSLLLLDVASNRGFCHRFARASEVVSRPERRRPASKARELVAQNVASKSFELASQLRNRPTRVGLNKQVK